VSLKEVGNYVDHSYLCCLYLYTTQSSSRFLDPGMMLGSCKCQHIITLSSENKKGTINQSFIIANRTLSTQSIKQ